MLPGAAWVNQQETRLKLYMFPERNLSNWTICMGYSDELAAPPLEVCFLTEPALISCLVSTVASK